MFTGIVQDIGEVIEAGKRLVVRGRLPYEIPIGGSVAVDGCCLTHVGGDDLTFDLSEETLHRTALGSLKPGDRVNLEAALRAGDPLGGHFVQGHVDAVGHFLGSEGGLHHFEAPPEAIPFLADKGSITVAGVSLTVVAPQENRFSVALIPHTLQTTTLGSLKVSGPVNLEYDLIARYALNR